MRLSIKGKEVPSWNHKIRSLWWNKVQPFFAEGEWCSDANYFAPRTQVDEYNRAEPHEGFVYTVQPGNRVVVRQWIPE